MKGPTIFLIILLMVVLGTGFFIFYNNSSNQQENTQNAQLSICMGITDDTAKRSCITQLAIENKDYSICNNLDDGNYCEAYVAGAKGDLSYCQTKAVEGMKDVCYQRVAVGTLDESKCELIHPAFPGIYNVCYGDIVKIKKDPAICEKMRTSPNECYLVLAINSSDKSICDKISYSVDRDYCYKQIN